VDGAIASSHSSNGCESTTPVQKLLGAVFDYIQALLCPVERKNGAADVRAGGIRQSRAVPTSVGQSASYFSSSKSATEVAVGKDALEP